MRRLLPLLLLLVFVGCNPVTLNPGQSINQAYQQGHDFIELKPGNYGDQTVDVDSGHPRTLVYGPGAKLSQLDNRASQIAYHGLDVDAGGQTKVALHNSGDDVRFQSGRVGNVVDEKGALISGDGFVFDKTVFHDVIVTNENVHNECLYAIVVPSMLIRDSTFVNCATHDILFTHGLWWNPPPPAYGNVSLQGNSFGASRFENGRCCHYYSVYFGNNLPQGGFDINGWEIKRNEFETGVAVNPPGGTPQACGNTGAAPSGWQVAC